jgi:UDP-N-acetylmuramoylalanine--D-glutamate ligase
MRMFLSAEEIVVSPGVPLDIEPLAAARSQGVPIVSELEVAFRYLQGEIVGITGSNGKTTTTTLVGEILKATGRPVQVGGNIGAAMTGLVDTSTPNTINVIEVSSFQLDGARDFRPRVGVLLNITPDHLDRYADFASYRTSKFRLFRNQKSSDCAVLNWDDPQVYPPPAPLCAPQRFFSRKHQVQPGAFLLKETLYLDGKPVMNAGEIPLRGSHNVENVLASMAVAGVFQVPAEAIAQTVSAFRGVEHRLEFVATVGGVSFYNDSKATNVDSSIKAVESFASNVILILGGKDKGASYMPLVEAMTGRVKHVLLIGAAASKIAAEIGDRFPTTRIRSMDEAVEKGLAIGEAGDVVLLSPACASFDMFDNYEHRGTVFKKAVEQKEWR